MICVVYYSILSICCIACCFAIVQARFQGALVPKWGSAYMQKLKSYKKEKKVGDRDELIPSSIYISKFFRGDKHAHCIATIRWYF